MIPPVPVADVPALVGHTFNWLQRRGFPVRDTRVVETPAGPTPRGNGSYAYAWARPGEVSFAGEDVAKLAARYGKRGPLNDEQLSAANTTLHELIHQMRYGRSPEIFSGPDEGPGYWEEAATEAAARDLLPNFVRDLFGHRMRGPGDNPSTYYEDRVPRFRRLSAAAAPSAKGWRGIPARQWRRTFSHSGVDERERMILEAERAIVRQRAQKAAAR